ncbi:MAG: hypothetical protein G5Z43_001512, partial [Caldisphaeraceae archaeon]|nr:hypothetical protein [Caldisphaeraceae archaeon]
MERKPLLFVTAKAVIEGQASSMKQEAPYISGGSSPRLFRLTLFSYYATPLAYLYLSTFHVKG